METIKEKTIDPLYANRHLFTVDYQYQKTDDEGRVSYDRHVIDQSFTFLHWNLVEQLAQGKLQLD